MRKSSMAATKIKRLGQRKDKDLSITLHFWGCFGALFFRVRKSSGKSLISSWAFQVSKQFEIINFYASPDITS